MNQKYFPDGFLWGTATSSFQVEMGLGEPSTQSDWYLWVHDQGNIESGMVSGHFPENGPGFWEVYTEDLKRAREELGNNAFRLSIDWPRIFPRSTKEVKVDVTYDRYGNASSITISEENMRQLEEIAYKSAIERYREILSEAKRLDLEVMVTLFHWPLPLWLHDPLECRDDIENARLKGWLDQQTIVEFAKYAAFTAHSFGDLVDLWATINEACIISKYGYLSPEVHFPPGLNDLELYLKSMKHLSMAHGLAYEQVKKWDKVSASDFGPSFVGVITNLEHYEPENPYDEKDVAAADFNRYLWNEWNLNAVIKGDYDMDLDKIIQQEEQLSHIAKGCDFIGVDYYLRQKVRYTEKGEDPKFDYDNVPCEGDCSDAGWEIYPPGIRSVLDWCYKMYRRPIIITENGVADAKDTMRTRALISHLEQVHKAIVEDNVPVMGYFYWSLIDNFSWFIGYKMRFGLYSVDMDSKKRTPTKAVPIYREIAMKNKLTASARYSLGIR